MHDKVVKKTVRVPLTDAETKGVVTQLIPRITAVRALEVELDAHKKRLGGKLKTEYEEIGKLHTQLAEGREAEVECVERLNVESAEIETVRLDTGEVIARRSAEGNDRQMALDDEPKGRLDPADEDLDDLGL